MNCDWVFLVVIIIIIIIIIVIILRKCCRVSLHRLTELVILRQTVKLTRCSSKLH